MVLTISAVAENKKINLKKCDIQITHRITANYPLKTAFQIIMDLGRGLTAREKKILFYSARSCEVNKMLKGEFEFHYEHIPEE